MAEMEPTDRRLLKRRRMLKRAEFRAAFRQGTSASGTLVTVYVRHRHPGEVCGPADPRLGISVPRRLGGAVLRNRAKRLIREAFRLNREALPQDCDVLVVPRGDWRTVKLDAVVEELVHLARSALRR